MADLEKRSKRYPTDLTDEEWALVRVFLPAPPRRGRKPATDLREVLNALRYLARTGGGWRMLSKDFKKLKMLRRHLMTHYGMTPEDYRAKWNLPRDYPMVAPNYAERRRALAKEIGLGTKGRGGGRKPNPRSRKSAK